MGQADIDVPSAGTRARYRRIYYLLLTLTSIHISIKCFFATKHLNTVVNEDGAAMKKRLALLALVLGCMAVAGGLNNANNL